MKWVDVKPDIEHVNIADVVKNWSAVDISTLMVATSEHPLIVFPNKVRQKIMTHLESGNVELGGLLIGSVVSAEDLSEGLVCIVVKDSFISSDCTSTAVSLSMSPSVWQSANEQSDNTTFVVGWYHSHPDLGAYFSGVDRKTQKEFFNSTYNLGLVIDPIRKEEEWFITGESLGVEADRVVSGVDALELV